MSDRVVEIKRMGGVARARLLSGEELKIPSALFLERRLRPGSPSSRSEPAGRSFCSEGIPTPWKRP